jgi:hypothetical protein
MALPACIDRITLLKLEDGGLEPGIADATRAHLAACGRCRGLAQELAMLSEVVERFADTRPVGTCPDALVLASFAEGRLGAKERADCEAHLADCGYCAADLAALGRELAGIESEIEAKINVKPPDWALARAHALVEPSREQVVVEAAVEGVASERQVESHSSGLARLWTWLRADSFPIAAAASLVLMALLQLPPPEVQGPRVRGAQYDSPDDIVLTSPAGETLRAGGVLSWDPAPGAGTYTVTVMDSSGNLVWTGESNLPRVAIPADLRLKPGAAYSWWVKTVTDSGEEIESPVGHFTAGQ